MNEDHTRLLARIYRFLIGPEERLASDWVSAQIQRLDRIDGDIDTLVQRIAHIRTWTYIANRPGWLDKSAEWQERTHAIEDKLSDALHDRITQRFVDRRSALLVRHLKDARDLTVQVAEDGAVTVEGHFVGEMRGLAFRPDPAASGDEARMLTTAANRMLRQEVEQRARRLAGDADAAFALGQDGILAWRGEPVARLVAGEVPLAPRIEPFAFDFLEGALRDTVRRRLAQFVGASIAQVLKPLGAEPPGLPGPARGLLYRLGETLGTLDAAREAGEIARLDGASRKALARLGIRFGTETIYLPALLKPGAIALRALLWAVHKSAPLPPPLPPPGRLSIAAGAGWPPAYGDAIGYRMLGPRAIRLDRLEMLAAALRAHARKGPFGLDGTLASLGAIPLAELAAVVEALGYRAETIDGAPLYTPTPRRPHHRKAPREPKSRRPALDHPFARLGDLGFRS